MKPKFRALLFNFIGFAVLFLIAHFALGYFLLVSELFLGIMSAIITTILAPKFATIKTDSGEKVMGKWIFKKGLMEL